MAPAKPPQSPLSPPQPKSPEVEMEDVQMVGDGKGNFRVSVVKIRGPVVAERVLEEKVSLVVARGAATSWRAKNGGLTRGLK